MPAYAVLVEPIERATIAAVSPEAVVEYDGWLLAFDSGTIGRAKSAVPLAHHPAVPGVVARIEAQYTERGLPAVFRLTTDSCFDGLRQELTEQGYIAEKRTCVQTARLEAVRRVTQQPPADVDSAPDTAWTALFLSEGFDAIDGASRVQSLSRNAANVYASVRQDGHTIAGGAASFGNGWASLHGIRTAQHCRGQGLAGRVLAGLAKAALQHGEEQVFLQVEAHNSAALALYQRAGFSTLWEYVYWSKARIKHC